MSVRCPFLACESRVRAARTMQRIVRLERARDVKPLAAPRAQAQGHEVAAEASGIYSEEAQFREELGLLFVKSACMALYKFSRIRRGDSPPCDYPVGNRSGMYHEEARFREEAGFFGFRQVSARRLSRLCA